MEKWKNIGSVYEISNTGLIRNKKTGRLLKTYISKGYHAVRIKLANHRKGYLIHRLVAQAFISNPENKKYVNHIDANKINNSIENLEWCTQKENLYHSKKITKNGAVISLQKIKNLYYNNTNLSLIEFIHLLETFVK